MIVADPFRKHFLGLANITADGVISTAAATVDRCAVLHLQQGTAGISLTLHPPTDTGWGYRISIVNTGSSAVSVQGVIIPTGAFTDFIWNDVDGAWSADQHFAFIAPVTFGANITLDAAIHHGRVIECTAAGAVTVTVPTGLPVGFECTFTQAGTGQITFVDDGVMALNNSWNAFQSAGQWAKIGLEVRAANSAILAGDLVP